MFKIANLHILFQFAFTTIRSKITRESQSLLDSVSIFMIKSKFTYFNQNFNIVIPLQMGAIENAAELF